MPTIEEIKAQLIQNPTYKNSLMAAPTGADYQVGLDKYNTYAAPDPLYDKYLNQSNLQSFGNTLERGVVKFALSIPENAGYMVDFLNSNNDFDNGLSQWARNLKEDVDREFPEYSKYFEDGFNPGDADWWFRNGDSIIESVGYMIPGLALGKGVGTFAKAMGAAANTARIAGTVTATLASNYAEGMQMAGARYRQLLDSGVSKEDAAKAASDIVNWNRANLILQYAESSMLLRGIGGATSMSGIGVKASLKDVGKQFLMEGFEEWNQGFIEEENVRSAMIKSGKAVDDGKSLFDRVKDYAFSDDALTQAFIGGIGGAVMQGGNDAVLNLDPKYREQKKLAFEQIGKNYGQLINLAEIVSKKQDEKDGAVSDEIAFNHKTKEQALDVVMANVENGTYSQFMKTFDSVLSMTDEEAAAKGLNKTEMAKMSEVLKPAMERMAKAYSRVEAEFRGKLPQEYIKEVAKQSYYSLIHAESAKEYGKKIDKTHSEIPFKNVTLSSINKKSSEIAALNSIIEETKNSKSEAAVEVHSAAVKLMTKLGNELSEEIDTAKSVYGDSYQESDWESPVYDSEIVADSKKKFEHEFISTFHNKEYKTYSSKTKVEELKKEAEEKNAAEEIKQKQETEAIFSPVRTAFKSASNIGEYLDESERTSAKATITSQFNSLKETEAYKKSSKTVQDKLEKEYLKALKTIENAKIKKVTEGEETETPEETTDTETDFVPTEGTMSRKRYSNAIRKKDNILTAGYLGQAYETVTDDKGNVHYKDLVDEEGNPKIISHADERLNDYTFFKPGEEIEIVLDGKYAALAGIPINEENLYRIPFGIRKAGSPITMWVHKFDAPVGTEIDSNIKRLIQEPKLDANGVIVSNLQEQEQKRLLALRKYLWENTQNNNVVKAKINSRTTGYSIETEPRPAANQLMVDGKVAEDVDFAMVVSGVITPITSEYTVSTEGRRDENGKLIFPEGALLVTVPGFAVDRAGNPVLEPYFAQAHQLSDNDVDVIMNVITRGKPSDAWAGLGFEIPSFEAFLSNYVYNGKNSGKVLIDIEKDGVKRNRYIYTTSLLKGSWDKKSRIRVWTNETANPITEKELQAAREFLSTLYYNFPKATKEYPQYSVKDGNLVFEGKVGYKERIANNTNVTIQGKRVGNTQRMQFFTQAVMGYEVEGLGKEEKKSPLGKNPLGVKILPPKKKAVVKSQVTDIQAERKVELMRAMETAPEDATLAELDKLADEVNAKYNALEGKKETPKSVDKKADIEKTLYPTISGSTTLTDALPDGIYIDLGNGFFAFADKKAKIAAIVDKNNNSSVSKSFWNESKKEWQLPNKANLEDDAKRFNDVNYTNKIQKATDSLNAKYDAEFAALEQGKVETNQLAETKRLLDEAIARKKEVIDVLKSKDNDKIVTYIENNPHIFGGLITAHIGEIQYSKKLNFNETDFTLELDKNVVFFNDKAGTSVLDNLNRYIKAYQIRIEKESNISPVKKETPKQTSSDPIASLFPIKSEILRVYKSNPGVSVFDLQGELPVHKDTLINAYRAYKKINPDTNVSSFVSEVIKAFKAVDGLSLTSPLRSVNKENVRDLQTVENKTSAYTMLTTSEDEVFNNDMRRLLSIVKDFNIIVDSSESPYLGNADSASDTIFLYKNNIAKAARPVRTILAHEVVHIATSQALANPTNNNEKLFATNINKTYLKAKNKLGKEAGENSKEFLAEFFSNKEFREKLNSVEKGLLEQILDWIKNLLGIPTTIEELVRDYTNTFIDNFTGYDRNFAMGSDPLYQEYRDNGISLSRRETLLSSISGYIINYVQNGITDEAEIKDAIKDTLIEAKDNALDEVVPILEKIISDDTFFDIVYNDAKQYVLKLDIGFDERENWQLDSRFEVNPWMTTSKQVRKFLASIPETVLQDGELAVISNEFALIPYKNPISLHANLAEVLAGKDVMEHLGYLSGLNPQGIVYDPVKAYIYYKLEEFRNGSKEEKQIFNAFNTDFKKYKAEFISIKHKETVATVGGQILEDENGLPQMAYSYDVYESNKTGSKTFLAQWYNSFLNRMTVDGNINKEKAEALLSRLNKADTGKNVDTAEVERILNEFGITMSPNAVELAINDPKSVDRRLNQGIIMKAIRMVITSATKVKADEEAFSINNPFIAEESNLKLLSRFEAQVNSTSFTSLFRTESGKNMYAVSNNYMLTRLEKQLKEKGEFLQNLSTDIYSKNSLLVNELNQGIDFDIKIFSEFVNLKGKPSAIKGLTSQERILVKMSAFNNRGEDTALIQFPTLEAKPVIPFLKGKRIHVTLENGKVNDGTVDLMYNIVKSEFDRIQRVKEEQVTLPYEEQVERYHFTRKGKDIHKPSASGLLFHLTPIMNEFEIDGIKVKDMSTEQFEMYEDSIKERLKDYAKEIIDTTWEDLIRADIATATNNGRSIKSKFLDSVVKNKLGKKIKQDAGSFTVEEYVANFALNYYIRQADIYQVFGGDIAYTKGHTDMAKRLAMLVAPGQDLDVAKDSLTVMAIPDRPVASPMIPNFIKVINHINEKYKDKGVNIDVEKTLESLKNINATDGQTWVGLDYKRDELDSLGRLDESTEELIELAEAGIDEAPKILPIGSSKIVYVGRVWDGRKYITLYLKTSTNTVLPGVHTPDLLEKTKRADLVAHESSIKIGMRGLSEEGVVHSVPRTGLAQQQEITYHGDDTAITALSQARRMLTEAFTDPVFKDLKYDFQGKKLGAADFRAQFQKLHIASVKEAWDRLADKLGVKLNDDEGKISYEITDLDKVRQLLLESGRLNDVEAELLEMKNGKFVIPLFFSPANERFESLLFSIISNRIISLDQNGSSFVQVSQKGFDNKNAQKIFDINELSPEILNEIKWLSDEDKANILRDNKGLRDMYFDGKKMKPAQILLPNVFKKFFIKNQDITLEDLRKSGLSEVFLMRSPYQLASGFSAEIVGFLPESAGEIIVVPNEAMIRIGFDFDVDKLYAYLYNAEFTEEGVNRIKYSTAPEEVEYRYKEYIKGRIFDIIDGNEVLEEEKEGLNNEFKETIKQIVKAKTDSVMGNSISKANDDFREALKTLPAYVIRQVKDIVYAKNTSLEQKEAGLAEYISSLKGNIQIKYSDLQKLEVEYNNFVFNVNRRKSIEQEYKNIIRETSGYDEMRKNLSNEVRNRLTDLAIESGKVPVTFAEFTSKSIEEQNSKKARENALLDQFMEVYSHPEIMYKLLTVNSEAPIAEAVDRIGRKSVKGSPLTMREQDRLFSAMKDSKTGISISSMWVTFQEALQNNKVKLKIYDYDKGNLIPINAGVKFLNEKGNIFIDTALLNDKVAKQAEDLLPKGYEGFGMYSIKTRGISQDLVGKYLLILQTATVDNAKNQGMYPANLNDYTLPTALYLGAMGIDDFDILVRFLNQPIILEYVDLMNNGFSHNKAVKTLFGKYGKSVIGLQGKPVKTSMNRLAIKAFSSKDLLNLIQNQDRTVDYYNDQLEILNKWAVYTESAMTLGSAATKANFDTKKLGKNYFDVQSRLKGYNDILDNKTFVKLDKVFENNVLGAYVEYGIIPANTMFNNEQLLPYHYRLYNKAYKMYTDNVFLNDGRFDDSTRRQFNKNILAFIASYANGVSDASERGALLSLPKEVSKLKEAYPDNLLLSRIDIIPGKPVGKKYDSMTFRRVGLDVSEVKYMVQSFTELLDNPETQAVAEKMIKYTFLFQGLAQSAGSLLTVIPPTYLLSTEFGSRYQSKDFQDKMNDLDMTELFFDQYAAHHPENFYPKYNKPVKGQDPTRLILTFEEAAVERGEDTIIPEYIKMDVRVGKRRFTVAAKKMSENETHVEYRALNPLGTTDFTEYSMDDYASLVNPVIVNDYTPFFRPAEIVKETVVEEVGDLPVNTMQESLNPSDYTNHSGGAYGGDTYWDIIGREFNVTNHKHYKDAGNASLSKQLRDKGVKAEILTKEQMEFARQKVKELLGITYKDDLRGNLQVRNFYQVYNAEAVYAIAKMNEDWQTVKGGTNTAVQLGIKLNKPVYVWDINTENWFEYQYDQKEDTGFMVTSAPTLTKNFAGVGSRDIENYNVQKEGKWVPREEYVGKEKEEKAKQAIRDVYIKTLSKPEENPNKVQIGTAIAESTFDKATKEKLFKELNNAQTDEELGAILKKLCNI